MQQSISQSNPIDSMIHQELPDYSQDNKSQILLGHDSGQSSSFSLNHTSTKINPFKDTVFEQPYDKLETIKLNFHKQRNALIEEFHLQKFNKQVIRSLLKNDQLQLQIKQQKKKRLQIQTQNQQKLQQIQQMKLQNKKTLNEKKVYEDVAQFQSKLKQKFNEERIKFQSQEQINQQIIKILNKNLNKRSQQTLNKLKSYLQESLKEMRKNNEIMNFNKKYLENEKSKYDKQIELTIQRAFVEQETNIRYELQDQIEDQQNLAYQIKQYQEQNRKDNQIERKKVFAE